MRRVYLDNNATSPLLPEVFEAMRPYFVENFGNASSIHQQGQQARASVERAREQVAELLNCRPAEVVFTSGGTEGDNLALFGLVRPGDHVITSPIEHHAILNSCKRLEDMGCEVTYLAVDASGLVDPDDIRRAIRPNTKLISIMFANNETGVLQDVNAIGAIAAEADVYFHTDAVQAAGKVSIDVSQIRCDLLTVTGHKMHGPLGAGALYVRKGTLLQAMLYGGSHERSRRAGTENLPGIVGLGMAAEIARLGFSDGKVAHVAELRDRLEATLLSSLDQVTVNGESAQRVPNTTNLVFEHLEGEAMVIALDLKGISVATGAACSSGAIEPSHVLTAMGLSPDRARGSIRFSLGKQNTPDDIDFALQIIPDVVRRLRELSPVYKKAAATKA
jgi:cysteine desulfurase